jgi:hypothetical protein
MSDTYTEFAALRYDPQQIAQQGYGVAASGPSDDRLIVGFYRKSILNTAKSKEQGKRVCEDRDFVLIQHPGETLTKVDRPVQDSDKQRWPRQWAQYQQGRQQIPDGIPVTLLFPAHPSITDMLLGYNIHTVEQLANLSGSAIQTVGMGCQEWVNRAKTYLTQAEKGVNFHKFEKTIEEKDRQIKTLERQVMELSRQMQKFMASAQPQQQPMQPMPQHQWQPPPIDVQSMQIAASMNEQIIDPEPQTFSNDIAPPQQGIVRQRKPRSDKGKPRGSRKGI